jgi:hypothetical protein
MAITQEELKSAVPKSLRRGVSKELIDQLHKTINDPIVLQNYTENIISYASVLKDGKFKLSMSRP